MSTYSASSSVRKAMLKAGWQISNHSAFGRKRTFTIANPTGETAQEILDHLERSPALPYRDKDFLEIDRF